MEFKSQLSDYTQDQFKALVSAIWHAEMDNDSHARLIDHFDKVVGHPLGADLLFYPPDRDAGNDHSVSAVAFHVKRWHNTNGRSAFRDEPVAVVPVKPPVRLSPEERKLAESTKDLAKAQGLAADIDAAAQSAQAALLEFTRLLDQWQAQPLDARSIEAHIEEMTALETAQSSTVRAMHALQFPKLRVQFARSDAERNISNSFRDPGIQASVLQIVTQTSDRHLAAVADADQRHRALHARCMPLFEAAEAHLVHRLAASGAPEKAPCVVRLSARATQLRPCLIVPNERTIDLRQLGKMKKAIRSAVAEFSWQTTSLDNEHPRSFSGIIEFFFDHWKDRDWYAASVPLSELMPIDGHDWQELARSAGEVDVPYRLFSRTAPVTRRKLFVGLKQITTVQQICLTPTHGDLLPAQVKVVGIDPAPSNGVHSLRVRGWPPLDLRWDLVSGVAELSLDDAPKTQAVASDISIPVTPLLESLDTAGDASFDDCVLVFPADSGLEPLYLMFKKGRGFPT
ncbi:bacteriocin immunity protein [Pseudomonas sp. zfem002]|uniref:bacteriocin immunity protein n=1 Tax=Pseudomonas sp. zfem002 TaxID=3078197 RepID=UPI00292896B4|nr:bacteriocin immunity protein [Pseudomonas sp. zfem002]MDU9392708.1 bacteriocin immunity protein [Pseudomonas sp. zfem002]